MKRSKRILLLLLTAALLTSCVSKTPLLRKQSEALRNLGEAYLSQGNTTAALRELLEAESLFADDFLLQDDLGKAYTAKKRYETALIHFQRSMDLQPDYGPAKNNMGSVFLLMKRWDDAIAVLNQVSDNILYATPHYPLYNLGWAYYNKEMCDKALSYYNKALEIQPQFVLPMRGIALCHMAEGRLTDAIHWLEKGVKAAPKFQQLHYELAGAYLKARAYDKTKAMLAKTMAIDPKTPLASKAERELKALSI
ncbi:lipopolysaccharide assembly protein LapB [Desulfoluna sp.]|uniref:tetratricopeptide repeat protein n=1 Tax=Desulfoluna sp. TaxID=2045199 RepID=UPI002612F7C2|nr:tetratricopeptide repeat protein [Desulfoluna sp.]